MDIIQRLQEQKEAEKSGRYGEEDCEKGGKEGDEWTPFVVIERGRSSRQTKRQHRLQEKEKREREESDNENAQTGKGKKRRNVVEKQVGRKARRDDTVSHPNKHQPEMEFATLCFGSQASSISCKRSEEIEENRATHTGRLFDDLLHRFNKSVVEMTRSSDEKVFEDICRFIDDSMPSKMLDGTHETWRHGLHPIPTGLLFAGGFNSADHARTFPALKGYLERKGCRVALISPVSFSKNSVSLVLARVLSQLKKDDEAPCQGICSSEDLGHWYSQEVVEKNIAEENAPSCPVVIIIESLESSRAECLQDVVEVLSNGYAAFPHVLLVGLTTTQSSLADALPYSLIDRCLTCCKFEMASAMQRLEYFVDKVLLGPWLGFIPNKSTIALLWEHFFMHHFALSIVVHGMRLALCETLFRHPCPELMGNPPESPAAAQEFFGQMKTSDLEILKSMPGSTVTKRGLSRSYCDMRHAWEEWKVSLKWLSDAGKLAGLHNECSLWSLYRDALEDGFLSAKLRQLLAKISNAYCQMDSIAQRKVRAKVQQRSEELSCGTPWISERLRGTIKQLGHAHQELCESTTENITERTSKLALKKEIAEKSHSIGKRKEQGTKSGGKNRRRDALLGQIAGGKSTEIAGSSKCVEAVEPNGDIWIQHFIRFFLDSFPDVSEWKRQEILPLLLCSLEKGEAYLTPPMRLDIHESLKNPTEVYAPSKQKNVALGAQKEAEDACIAYQLFDEDPSRTNLVDWFLAFECVVKDKGKSKEKKIDRKDIIGRFSQALQDLQFIGMIQSSRRKKGDHIQRSVYLPSFQ